MQIKPRYFYTQTIRGIEFWLVVLTLAVLVTYDQLFSAFMLVLQIINLLDLVLKSCQ